MDRAIDAVFLFAGRLVRTALALAFKPRHAASLIWLRVSDPANSPIASDAAFLLVTCLLGGIRLRTTSNLINEQIHNRHFHALAQALRDLSLGGAMFAALPLVAVSVLLARAFAVATTRHREDRRFTEALLRYALGESYLIAFVMGTIPGLAAAVLEALPFFQGPRPAERLLLFTAFAFIAVMVVFFVAYLLLPALVPAWSVKHGLRLLNPAGRRRYARAVALVPGAVLVMLLAPEIARRMYALAARWVPDSDRSISVAIASQPPVLTDRDRSCPRCPSVTIPVMVMNTGRAPVALQGAAIHVDGYRVRRGLTDLAPVVECDWLIYAGVFTEDVNRGMARDILRPGEMVTGRIQAHIPRSVLAPSACDDPPAQVRAAFMATEISSDGGDVREATSNWSSLNDLCAGARTIPEQVNIKMPDEAVLWFPQTIFEGLLLHSQCSFRFTGLVTSASDEDTQKAMELFFGKNPVGQGAGTK